MLFELAIVLCCQTPRGRRARTSGRLHCSRRHHVRACLTVTPRTDPTLHSGTVRGVASSRLPAGATLLYEKGAEVSCRTPEGGPA